MSTKLVIDTFRANSKIKSDTLGDLELKYISVGDIEFSEKKLSGIKGHGEFVSRMIHHQLVSPEIEYSKFKNISEDELRKIARNFIKHEKYTFKHFRDTSDDEFFQNFRSAIQKHLEEERKKIQGSFASAKRTMAAFAKSYSGILGQLQSSVSPLSRLVRETSQLNRLVRDAQFSFSLFESLKPAIQQYQSAASLIEKALRPQINLWQEWTQKNKRLFEGFDSYWKSFHDKYKISEQEAIRILKKYKWFVSPSLPIDFVFEVVKIGRKKGNHRGEINRLFVEYFRSDDYEELEALVNNWQSNDIFKPRMKIFRDCIDGLKNAGRKGNPSNFVLPALIAQIDGILQEYMEKNVLSFDLRDRKWKYATGQKVDWKKWYKSRASRQDMDDLANEIFLNILFQSSQRGVALETPFTFNRHKIMHGENLRYGRIDNTIRAFLVLDFLASLK